jgi:hypothetical protein
LFFCFFTFHICAQDDEKLLLVVSCGGGGTHYTAQCLQNVGIAVGHEHVGTDGYVGWPFAAGPYHAYGASRYKPPFKHTFHQVREPLKVISTWMNSVWTQNLNHGVLAFIRREIPEIKNEDSLCVQCAKYWYYWNLKAEKISEWRYKVEDFVDLLDEFEARLQVYFDKKAVLLVPKNTYHWERDLNIEITWQYLKENLPEVLYTNLQNMAASYGYSIEDTPEDSLAD